MAEHPTDWPDRRVTVLAPNTTLVILSTLFALWRVIYGIKTKRKGILCDVLLSIAVILNISSIIIRYQTCHHGLGRHLSDPSITKPHDVLLFSYYLWIGQILNMLAITFLKYSICIYLLALNFSRLYLGIVWASILMVTVFNLVVPMMSVFCRTPLEANWNRQIPGKCFLANGHAGLRLAWTQGVSNIISDIVYVVAPMLYLSSIQLPRRTQWGLRAVFCLGLLATICSILKTKELPSLMKTKDPTWELANLAMWSGIELSVGILIASLPPLRKQFEVVIHKTLSSNFLSSSTKSKMRSTGGNSIPLYEMARNHVGGGQATRGQSGDRGNCDDESSERGILGCEGSKGGIRKTVVREVRSEDGERGGSLSQA